MIQTENYEHIKIYLSVENCRPENALLYSLIPEMLELPARHPLLMATAFICRKMIPLRGLGLVTHTHTHTSTWNGSPEQYATTLTHFIALIHTPQPPMVPRRTLPVARGTMG